jgi:hypothetical protein
MSGLSITIHDVDPINAGMVANIAQFANCRDFSEKEVLEALSCNLDAVLENNYSNIDRLINECGDETFVERRLLKTLETFRDYKESSDID